MSNTPVQLTDETIKKVIGNVIAVTNHIKQEEIKKINKNLKPLNEIFKVNKEKAE